MKKGSGRNIVNIVDKTDFPPTPNTSPDEALTYTSLNPAIDAKFVHPLNFTYSNHRFSNDFSKIEWFLPGKKGIGKIGVCSVPHGATACLENDPHKKSVYNAKRWYCGKIGCVSCWDHETMKQAKEKMQRFRGISRIYDLFSKRDKKLCHVVISAPPEDARLIGNVKGYNQLKESAYRIMGFFDMDGFVIFHPCRGKKDNRTDVHLFDEDIHEGVELSNYWRLGPHWHFVGFVDSDYVKQNSALFYKETGWIIKIIADDMDYDHAETALSYCLTHEGIGQVSDQDGNKVRRSIQGVKSVGRFMATKKDSVVKLYDWKERISETCSECGSLIYNIKEFDIDEDIRQNERLVLHHFAFCRREYRDYYLSLFEELTPEFKGIDGRRSPEEYYESRLNAGRWIEERAVDFDSFEVAIAYDLRSSEITADCDVISENSRAEMESHEGLSKTVKWAVPEGFRGQSDIFMSLNPIPCNCSEHRKRGAFS